MSRLCRLKTASHGEDGKWAHGEIVRLRERVAELEASLAHVGAADERMEKDAARYCWLRDIGQDRVDVFFSTNKNASVWGCWDSHSDIDAAIDEAMKWSIQTQTHKTPVDLAFFFWSPRMILTRLELIELTRRVKYSSQAKQLSAMSIPYRKRTDGSLVVFKEDLFNAPAQKGSPSPRLHLPSLR